jgi:recombination protein RecA
MERLILLWPDSAEQSTDMYTDCVKSNAISVFMYDSIGGSPSQRVTDKSATVGNIGGNALAMTRFAQFASIYSSKYNCLTICINQIRDDMGGYNRLTTPGGHGLKHAYSLRVELKPGKDKFYDEIDGEKVQVGYNVVAKIIKNSLAPPYRAAHYLFYFTPCKYGFGIDTLEETIRLGILTDVIHQGGRWYNHPSLPEGKVGSRDILIDCIRSDQALQDKIVSDILERLKKGNVQGISTTFDPDDEKDSTEDRLLSVGYVTESVVGI